MTDENIYRPPKSNLGSERELGFTGLLDREKNMIACIVMASVASYALGVAQSSLTGKGLSMSPSFLGALFPISAIISAIVIRFMGNKSKVYVDYVISMKTSWALGWRIVASSILSLIAMVILSLAFGFKADSSPIEFFIVYWVFVLPFISWILYAQNKKQHLIILFKAVRGY